MCYTPSGETYFRRVGGVLEDQWEAQDTPEPPLQKCKNAGAKSRACTPAEAKVASRTPAWPHTCPAANPSVSNTQTCGEFLLFSISYSQLLTQNERVTEERDLPREQIGSLLRTTSFFCLKATHHPSFTMISGNLVNKSNQSNQPHLFYFID